MKDKSTYVLLGIVLLVAVFYFIPKSEIFSIVTSDCYQGLPNQTTNCGADPTGTIGDYSNTGWWPRGNIADGNWSTLSNLSRYMSGELLLNYKKPNNVVSATWLVKTSQVETSLTIPESCWNYSNTTLTLRVRGQNDNNNIYTINFECYDGIWIYNNPGINYWKNMGHGGQYYGAQGFFEQAITWRINREVCDTNWQTTAWSSCINGTQTRNVTDLNHCNSTVGKPVSSEVCVDVPITPSCTESDWQCTSENCLSNNQQLKTCAKIGNCIGGISHPYQEYSACTYQAPNCTYTYSNWSQCTSSGTQNRTFIQSPTVCNGNPIISQTCEYKSSSFFTDEGLKIGDTLIKWWIIIAILVVIVLLVVIRK